MPSAEIFVSRVSARIKSATAMLPTNAITGTRTPEYAEAPAFRTMIANAAPNPAPCETPSVEDEANGFLSIA